jgi:hypothetical protein
VRATSGQDLYETLSRHTKHSIVVDSCKNVDWIEQQIATLRDLVSLYLIVLTRDGRAVVNSMLRKYPKIPARDHATAWVAQMRGTENLATRWPGSVHRMRYEELALRPKPTLCTLVRFLNIAFDPGMLDPWDSEQHLLGGNMGTQYLLVRERAKRGNGVGATVIQLNDKTRGWYGEHPGGILLDLRWKREMSADALEVFEAVAGKTNQAYAWKEPVE